MTEKRVVHAEVDNRTWVDTDGLNNGLRGLMQHANDACNFEDILEMSIKSLYKILPDGEKNYGDEKPKFGKIWFSRLNAHKKGHAVVQWSPSDNLKEKMNIKYIQKTIANIDLQEKTYTTPWKNRYDEKYYNIPEKLMRDTENIMNKLGLEKQLD